MMASQPIVDQFERERPRLQAIATRIVGSAVEAEDVMQEAWLRLARVDTMVIENVAAWLTVVVSRISLDHVRARVNRREEPIDAATMAADQHSQSVESTVILAESVYEALARALDRLSPLEAIALILHDVFQVPFDEIAAMIDRTSVATRKLASRARTKVSAPETLDPPNLGLHREVVDAFMRAARTGDLTTLLALLSPSAALRADRTTATQMGVAPELHGAANVAAWFEGKAQVARITWFDGMPGAAWAPAQRIRVAFTFAIRDGTIEEIILRSDPDWLNRTDIEIEPRPRRKNAGG